MGTRSGEPCAAPVEKRPWSRRGVSLACAGLVLGRGVAAATPPPDAGVVAAPPAAELPAKPPLATEPRAKPPWPQIAALVPGVLIHGSGTWLEGRTLTTERSLLLEASALLAIVAGGLVIYETGAARDYAGAATFAVAAGVGTFGASFLANVYATVAPPSGWGEPRRRLPWLVAGVGYTFVDDVQFDYHHFATTRLDGRWGAGHLLFEIVQSPGAQNQWLELQAGYRVKGPRAADRGAPGGSYLEPKVGFSRHAFGEDGFVSRVLAFELEGRLDSERLLPDVRGAYFQASAGLARQWVSYELPGANASDAAGMLLLHVGFGVYLGRRGSDRSGAPNGAELELYYDHRRDGFSGGIETGGATSGFAGHGGLLAEWFFSRAWGVRAIAEVGSGWVLGLTALMRMGGE